MKRRFSMADFKNQYTEVSEGVIDELSRTLQSIKVEDIEKMVAMILSADKVFFVGVGRVLLSLEAIAKRWAHLGIETHIVGEITEPAITSEDVLVVGSGSGNSLFPVAIAEKAKTIDAKIIHIGSNSKGKVGNFSDHMVRIPVRTKEYLEDELDSIQPMSSLFEQSLLLFGDIVAKMIVDKKGLDLKGLWRFHANLE